MTLHDEAPLERVLLYDGVCALCNKAVQLVLHHDPGGRLRFAPLNGDYAASLLQRHPELRDVDSIVLVTRFRDEKEGVAVRSEAAIQVAEYLGGRWTAARLLRVLPRRIRDAAYDIISRRRYGIFGKYDTCPVPPVEVRSRFLA